MTDEIKRPCGLSSNILTTITLIQVAVNNNTQITNNWLSLESKQSLGTGGDFLLDNTMDSHLSGLRLAAMF